MRVGNIGPKTHHYIAFEVNKYTGDWRILTREGHGRDKFVFKSRTEIEKHMDKDKDYHDAVIFEIGDKPLATLKAEWRRVIRG